MGLNIVFIYFHGATFQVGHGLLMILLRHITLGRTPLDESPVRHRDLYLITHQSKETYLPPAGFEPAIPESERPQTDALDGAAIGIGFRHFSHLKAIHSRCVSDNKTKPIYE
jgi:hypothetical protein